MGPLPDVIKRNKIARYLSKLITSKRVKFALNFSYYSYKSVQIIKVFVDVLQKSVIYILKYLTVSSLTVSSIK